MSIKVTRALLNAALSGSLANVPMETDPYFGFQVPREAPGVPRQVLNPRGTWQDPGAYDEQARKLAQLFCQNFEQFKDAISPAVAAAGPQPQGRPAEAVGAV